MNAEGDQQAVAAPISGEKATFEFDRVVVGMVAVVG
jgi:hypothetical protein